MEKLDGSNHAGKIEPNFMKFPKYNFQNIRQIRNFFFKKQEPNFDLGTCTIIQKTGNVSTNRSTVPDTIAKPPYYKNLNKPSETSGPIEIKTEEQIKRMRESCKLAANILSKCGDILEIGMTTDDIDAFVHNETIANNAYPSPLRYCGFPKSVCTSVNNVACHGIPDDRPLEDGDIINIDISVFLNSYHGDCSKTFLVGNVDERGRYLVEHNEKAVMQAINICKPGRKFHRIGKTISKYAKKCNLRTVPAFIGHGIGNFFHGPPSIYHFENYYDVGVMYPGMTFTIEPVFSLGTEECEVWEDGWTAVTVDGSRTSQFEHTILITESGCEILTLPD